jgi:hypothetical protein
MQQSHCKTKYDILSKNEMEDEQCMVKWPKQQSKMQHFIGDYFQAMSQFGNISWPAHSLDLTVPDASSDGISKHSFSLQSRTESPHYGSK